MNKATVKANIRSTWPKLSDAEQNLYDTNRGQFVAKVNEDYGISDAEARLVAFEKAA